jgi:type II secretory pathway component GspD/PulD (secretin)
VPQVVTPDPQLTAAIRQTTGAVQPTTAFDTRSLTTTAQLQDGQSLLVAGLQTRKIDRSDGRVPFVHRVPLLGLLFQSFADQDDQVDLVILVEPTIVRPPVPDAGLWAFPGGRELLNGTRAGGGSP